MKKLENKVALVTGGASGIGKAIVETFIKAGAKVVVADLNEKLGHEMVNGDGDGNIVFIKADASSPEDNKKIVDAAIENFGALHIAVNNAGIGGAAATVGDYPIDSWNKVIAINLNGVFYGMHYQLPEIEKVGGSIINMASILGSVGFAQSSAYVAAKHGVVGLTKSAAWEYGARGVRINAIGPGFISTPLIDDNLDEETQQYLASQHAMQRLGKPEEVAELALWLASDKSSFVTGSYYPVDGGYLAK
ncbi:NAD(P)-dependent dehydrogenase (short-subunit alcohol dehydrogenase family) [Sphingobacterium allocomposti]|uniref:NAD(P)-dependent dehydrogenase (Short-subunit alcohol dehydrogenase family) n=1 Tax=Sphingobacterium allocomposti TaxID=415956 RepID=A0A5S5DKH5_9SPHI|nr:SDR family NAD(P)-dependent oxidoreductase [Sphingobacterium composti Yoo et al. 2007 non Ten et al. 2007]TYP96417.1 NAD(P)-dependent dehydrogenase (short-subunit alcohol dehydrogenase family) [Sphingobacterium composti Yoo et al. 2007 non Ten et al. 2007]